MAGRVGVGSRSQSREGDRTSNTGVLHIHGTESAFSSLSQPRLRGEAHPMRTQGRSARLGRTKALNRITLIVRWDLMGPLRQHVLFLLFQSD